MTAPYRWNYGQRVAKWADENGTALLRPNGLSNAIYTDTSTTLGLVNSNLHYKALTYTPSGTPDQSIRFTAMNLFYYDTAENTSGAGHYAAALSWYKNIGTGNPNYAIGHESRLDNENASATITAACAQDNVIGSNAGTIGTLTVSQDRIVSNTGTITLALMNSISVTNTGTIGTLYGAYFPDLSAVTGITTRYAYVNADAGAPIKSIAPVYAECDQRASPTAGQTVTVDLHTDTLYLTPAGTLATLTIALPAVASLGAGFKGKQVEVHTSQTITTLTVTSAGAAFVIAPATAGPAKGFVLKYDSVNNAWWCKSA